MARKAKPKLSNKKIAKDLSTPKEKTPKRRYYFRNDKVAAKLKDGWKVVKDDTGAHKRTLGIKTSAIGKGVDEQSDLVLMEK